MKKLVIAASVLLMASHAYAWDKTSGSTETKKVYRSRSGGSAMADTIEVKTDSDAANKANSKQVKAMISDKAIQDQANGAKATKKVYLSRSGGSATSQTVEVPANKN